MYPYKITNQMNTKQLQYLSKDSNPLTDHIHHSFIRHGDLAASITYYILIEIVFTTIEPAMATGWPKIHKNKIINIGLKMAIEKEIICIILTKGVDSLYQTSNIEIESYFDKKHYIGSSKEIGLFIHGEINRQVESIKKQLGSKGIISGQGVQFLIEHQKRLIKQCIQYLRSCNQEEFLREIEIQQKLILQYKVDELNKAEIIKIVEEKLTRLMNMRHLSGRTLFIKRMINYQAQCKNRIVCFENEERMVMNINLVQISHPAQQNDSEDAGTRPGANLDIYMNKFKNQAMEQKLTYIFGLQPNIQLYQPENRLQRQHYRKKQLLFYLFGKDSSIYFNEAFLRRNVITKNQAHYCNQVYSVRQKHKKIQRYSGQGKSQQKNNYDPRCHQFYSDQGSPYYKRQIISVDALFNQLNQSQWHTYSIHQQSISEEAQFNQFHQSQNTVSSVSHQIISADAYFNQINKLQWYTYSIIQQSISEEAQFNQFHQSQRQNYERSQQFKRKSWKIFSLNKSETSIQNITQFHKNVNKLLSQNRQITINDVLKISPKLQFSIQVIVQIFKTHKSRKLGIFLHESGESIDIFIYLQQQMMTKEIKEGSLGLQQTSQRNIQQSKKYLNYEKWNQLEMRKDIEKYNSLHSPEERKQIIKIYKIYCYIILSNRSKQSGKEVSRNIYESIQKSQNYQNISDLIAPFLKDIDQKLTFFKN